jgi:four helix bundle protein
MASPSTRHNFDLEERTLEFAKNVIGRCKKLPRNSINHEIVGQLIRSSGSVGANYREANDALSKKDFAQDGEKLLNEAVELKKIFSAIVDKCV